MQLSFYNVGVESFDQSTVDYDNVSVDTSKVDTLEKVTDQLAAIRSTVSPAMECDCGLEGFFSTVGSIVKRIFDAVINFIKEVFVRFFGYGGKTGDAGSIFNKLRPEWWDLFFRQNHLMVLIQSVLGPIFDSDSKFSSWPHELMQINAIAFKGPFYLYLTNGRFSKLSAALDVSNNTLDALRTQGQKPMGALRKLLTADADVEKKHELSTAEFAEAMLGSHIAGAATGFYLKQLESLKAHGYEENGADVNSIDYAVRLSRKWQEAVLEADGMGEKSVSGAWVSAVAANLPTVMSETNMELKEMDVNGRIGKKLIEDLEHLSSSAGKAYDDSVIRQVRAIVSDVRKVVTLTVPPFAVLIRFMQQLQRLESVLNKMRK